jgi:hypothetical protein
MADIAPWWYVCACARVPTIGRERDSGHTRNGHPMKNPEASPLILLVSLVCLVSSAACGEREPKTDAERLARGREIVNRMSERLGAAKTFRVTTDEMRVEVAANGQLQKSNLHRETIVSRPDRLYSKVTSARQREVWYDGVGLTIVMHDDKVFAQARMPETLDKTLDAMHERYGVAMPMADFVYSSPAKALLSDTVTGGWLTRQDTTTGPTDRLSFKDKGVTFDLWVAATGDPLPRRAVMEFPDDKHVRMVDLTFADWNFSPQIDTKVFSPHVPADYEGIAMVQRARVLRHMKESDGAAKVP